MVVRFEREEMVEFHGGSDFFFWVGTADFCFLTEFGPKSNFFFFFKNLSLILSITVVPQSK